MVLSFLGLALSSLPGAAAPPSGWGVSAPIETDNAGGVLHEVVALGPDGSAFAAWAQSNGSTFHIWANRYLPATGWATATPIESNGMGSASNAQVGVDAEGNAIAVWLQRDSSSYRTSIWSNRYVVNVGWGAPERLDAPASPYPNDTYDPSLAVSSNGVAFAVWSSMWSGMSGFANILAKRFEPGIGWGGETALDTLYYPGFAQTPKVAVDDSGDAVVVWIGNYPFTAGYQNLGILAQRYVGRAWLRAEPISINNSCPAAEPSLASDSSGNAVAVWKQCEGPLWNLWSNRLEVDQGGTWRGAELIERNDAGSALLPHVAVSAKGDTVAVWQQSDGVRDNVWANRVDAASRWGKAELIETENAGPVGFPQVAVDDEGTAIAVWHQSNGTINHIWTNRFTPASGWASAALIETDHRANAVFPKVAMGAGGDAIAVWSQSDGTPFTALGYYFNIDGTRHNVWASAFKAPDVTPPNLVLTAPLGADTPLPSTWVAGTTEPGAAVTVNGYAAAVAADGSFGLLLPLQPGYNQITVIARDAAGNAANQFDLVRYLYDDPAALHQQLDATQASLDAAIADLTAAQGQVDALEVRADAAQADLASARADLSAAQTQFDVLASDANTTQGELDAARADLAAAGTRVAALEVGSDAQGRRYDAAQANLTAAQARLAVLENDLIAIRGELSSNQAELGAARADFNATQVQAAPQSGDSPLGVVLGLAGIGIGAVGVGMAARAGRGKRAQTPPAQPPTAPERPQ